MTTSNEDRSIETACALRAAIERRGLVVRTLSLHKLGVIAREVLSAAVYADVVETARRLGENPVEFAGFFVKPLLSHTATQ